ncbi:MAG: class I SAM-dependent methyltransferase [Thermoplasmata archaeon]|nr:class I SAM-dependent methyltransferase [Thermoplasmata archaeon]
MPRASRLRSSEAIELVRRGWDRAASFYRPPGAAYHDAFGHTRSEYAAWLDVLRWEVEPHAPVLELGCGSGVPAGEWLAGRFDLTGVDVSKVQVDLARRRLRSSRILHASMTDVAFRPDSFAAVVALYSIIHVPLTAQPRLLKAMYRWLRPGGLFLAVLGEGAYTGVGRNWLGSGASMYWSHADRRTYARWLARIGFVLLRRSFLPEGRAGHALFLARKPFDRSSTPGPAGLRR